MKKSRLSALLMAAGLLAGANAMAGDMRAAVVSNPCAGCHGTDGASAGEAPVIAGLSRVYLMQTMQNYKNGTRFSTIMGRIAKGYDSGQMNDMAVFYSELPWVDGKQDIDADLAAKGKDLHNSRGCNTCHGANGISPMPAAPRLAGQFADYMVVQMQYYQDPAKPKVPMAMPMQGMLAGLSEDDLKALAAFYASQK
ncbi:MAG: c-type cytochrome [Chromatiales bacterium]|nr:c-type cytochrome [Chromatiales bacterium]